MKTQLLGEPLIGRLTIGDLQKRLDTFEAVYGLSTESFLSRYADASDPLDDIEDMEPWFESHAILERLRAEGEAPEWRAEQPEIISEGSKEPSLLFYGFNRICEFYGHLNRSNSGAFSGIYHA